MFDNQDTPSIEELFQVVSIDRHRKVKMHTEFRDASGDEVPIRETIEKITEFVSDKLESEEGNTCKQQVMPAMAQAVVSGLAKSMGINLATYMLGQSHIRYGLLHMMIVAFHLAVWLKKKDIKIHTIEEALTDEDLEMYDRISNASDVITTLAAMGGDPKELLQKMIQSGQLKESDLKNFKFKSDNSENN